MLLRQQLWRNMNLIMDSGFPYLRNIPARSRSLSSHCPQHLSCRLALSSFQHHQGCCSRSVSNSLPNSHMFCIKIFKRKFSKEELIPSTLNSDITDSENDKRVFSDSPVSDDNALAVVENSSVVSVTDKTETQTPARRDKHSLSVLEQVLHEIELEDLESSEISSNVNNADLSTQVSTLKVDIPPLYSVSPIVNESQTLKNLVELGVDVSLYEKRGMAGKLIQMDFKKDVQPYIMFLFNAGVPEERFGSVLSRNPYIFEHKVEDLKLKVKYLRSKRFLKDQIGQMISREPTFLCMKTARIDAKLGFYQNEWRLKGQEIRDLAILYPRLLLKDVKTFKDNKVYMKAFLEFTPEELRQMFLKYPRVYYMETEKIVSRYDYLNKVMGIPNSMISNCAWVLDRNLSRLQNRHRFLVKKGRAQYDPTKENYVSMQDLMQKDKSNFCMEVAKASVNEFDDFQRLI